MKECINWQTSAITPPLGNQVHIWFIDERDYLSQSAEFFHILSREEQVKAKRFRFERDRVNYIIAHALLRKKLSQYLDCHSRDIAFTCNDYGKPFIDSCDLNFNLSHSRHLILVALSYADFLGVDVEYQRHIDSVEGIADRFFSESECRQFFALPKQERSTAFYRLWTKKEAWIKAVGKGLTHSLATFGLDCMRAEESKELLIDNQSEALLWQVRNFVPAENYQAAVVWQGASRDLLFLTDLKR